MAENQNIQESTSSVKDQLAEAARKNTSPEELVKQIKALAKRISKGEKIESPDDLQLQANHPAEIEKELKALIKKTSASVSIEMEETGDTGPEPKTVNIKDKNFLKNFIDKKPKKAIVDKPKEPELKGPVSEIQKKIIEDEKNSVDTFDVEDFEMASDFIIEALELGTSTGFRWWAGDTSDAPYEMTKSKKEKLKRLLTKILIRYAVKAPLIWLFLVTLVLVNVTPWKKAKAYRKETKSKPKTLPVKSGNSTKSTSDKSTGTKSSATKTTKTKKTSVRKPGGVNK